MATLGGLPLFFGFISKHLALLALAHNDMGYYLVSGLFLSFFFSLFYSVRLIYIIFFDSKKGRKSIYLEVAKANFRRQAYTNSSPGSSLSMLMLMLVGVCVISLMYNVLCYSMAISWSDLELLYGPEFGLELVGRELSLFFNSSAINAILLVFLSFLCGFKFSVRQN